MAIKKNSDEEEGKVYQYHPDGTRTERRQKRSKKILAKFVIFIFFISQEKTSVEFFKCFVA